MQCSHRLAVSATLAILTVCPGCARSVSSTPNSPLAPRHDECVVHYLKDLEADAPSDEECPAPWCVELGRFLTDAQGEGSLVIQRFSLPGSDLHAVVSVFYEDDLLYEKTLQDAITFKLSVTASQETEPEIRDWIGFAMTQVPDDHFRVSITALTFNNGKVPAALLMRCERERLAAPTREPDRR
jgi:hypothetical protein